jgi:hypothetical protein
MGSATRSGMESHSRGEYQATPMRHCPLASLGGGLSRIITQHSNHGVCISPQKGSIQITPLVPTEFSANSQRISSHIDGPLAVYGTPSVRLECLYLATFNDDETLAWILHVTGNDRLGTIAIYLNLESIKNRVLKSLKRLAPTDCTARCFPHSSSGLAVLHPLFYALNDIGCVTLCASEPMSQ